MDNYFQLDFFREPTRVPTLAIVMEAFIFAYEQLVSRATIIRTVHLSSR